jgi:hypothetical protein
MDAVGPRLRGRELPEDGHTVQISGLGQLLSDRPQKRVVARGARNQPAKLLDFGPIDGDHGLARAQVLDFARVRRERERYDLNGTIQTSNPCK